MKRLKNVSLGRATAIQLGLAAVATAGAWLGDRAGEDTLVAWWLGGVPMGIVALIGHRIERLSLRRTLHGPPGLGIFGAVLMVPVAWYVAFRTDEHGLAAMFAGSIVGSVILDLLTVRTRGFLRHADD